MTDAYKVENKPIKKHEYKVENKPSVQGSKYKYPLHEMKVGQSFYIAPSQFADLLSIKAMATREGRINGTQFSVRKDGDGYRCGRVK